MIRERLKQRLTRISGGSPEDNKLWDYVIIGGGSLMSFVDAPSMRVVVGGAIAAGMISFVC